MTRHAFASEKTFGGRNKNPPQLSEFGAASPIGCGEVVVAIPPVANCRHA